MFNQIRTMLGHIRDLVGTVETDETFIGGKEKNKQADKRFGSGRGRWKAGIWGAMERGTVVARVVAGYYQAHGAPT